MLSGAAPAPRGAVLSCHVPCYAGRVCGMCCPMMCTAALWFSVLCNVAVQHRCATQLRNSAVQCRAVRPVLQGCTPYSQWLPMPMEAVRTFQGFCREGRPSGNNKKLTRATWHSRMLLVPAPHTAIHTLALSILSVSSLLLGGAKLAHLFSPLSAFFVRISYGRRVG